MNNQSNLRVIAISTGKILSMIATFVIPVILARIFTKSDYGIFNQFNAVYLFCAALFSLGFQSNLYYFYPNIKQTNKRSLLIQTFLVLFVLSLIASIFIIIPQLNHLLLGDESLKKYATYIALAVMFLMVSTIIEPLYVIRGDLKISLFYPLANTLLKALSIILFVIYLKTVKAAIIGTICSLFILFIYTIFYTNKEIKNLPKGLNFNFGILKQQIKYSLPFGLSVSIRTIITKVDQILAISYLSTTSYAIYSVAFFAIPGVKAIYNSLSQVYILEMAEELKMNNTNRVIAIYHDLVSKSYSYTIPSLILIYFFADTIITTLFTIDYIDSVILFRIYLFSTLFLVLGAGIVLRASGKTNYTLKAYLMSSALSLPLTFYLISTNGAIGAIISALIAIILPALFLLRFEIKILKSNVIDFFPWKNIGLIVLISLLCFIPIYLIFMFLEKGLVSMIISSLFYLTLVSIIESKYNIFIVERDNLNKIISKFRMLLKK